MPPPEVWEDVSVHNVVSTDNSDTVNVNGTSGERPKEFGLHPDFSSSDFDFEKELGRLPFPLNLGKVEMSGVTTRLGFSKLIYDNKSVFSLCDEDLGLCDWLKHTIPTTMDKPVYLPHRDYSSAASS